MNSQKKDRYYNFLVHFRFHQVGLMWWYGLVVWGVWEIVFFFGGPNRPFVAQYMIFFTPSSPKGG